MEHASGWRHGGGPAAGLAASRHPRRHRQQLHRCSGGLRQRAAPCLAGVPLQAQMLAAWRRPPRGVPVRPKCLGVIHSGRPFQARDAYDGCSRVRRPSGEPGLRVVARVDLCIAREKSFVFSHVRCKTVGTDVYSCEVRIHLLTPLGVGNNIHSYIRTKSIFICICALYTRQPYRKSKKTWLSPGTTLTTSHACELSIAR